MRFTFRTVPIFLFFHLICIVAYGQTQSIDSLKIELQNHKTNDTTKVNLLYDLAFMLFQKDIELTNSYIEEAERISKDLDYKKGEANILSLKGIVESRKANYEKGLDYFYQSLEIFESLNDIKGIASSYNSIGVNYLQQSKNNDAIIYLKKSFKIYEEINDKNKLVAGSLNLGSIHSKMGKYPEAISFFEQALRLSKEINHEYGLPYSLSNLGHIYSEQGNHPLALEYYNEGLYYKEKAQDTIGIAITLNSLGNEYRTLGKLDKSLEYHERSLGLASKVENKDLVATNMGNIGLIYMEEQKYEEALKFMDEAFKISQEINDFGQMVNCLFNIGEINLLLKRPKIARQNFEKSIELSSQNNIQYSLALNYVGVAQSYLDEMQYVKALSFTQKAKNIAEELGLLEVQRNSFELLAKIYNKTGDFKKAYESHQQFKLLDDSLFNKENIEKIAQLEYEYKYKLELDSANIRELKLTKTVLDTSQDLAKTRQNYLWAIIGILLISIVLGTLIFIEKLKNEKSKTKNVIVEQKLLRSQMTPHFIFNSLSVLQGMILNKEESKSVNYLSKFSKLLRIILENSRDKLVLLSKEITAIENYLSLHNLEDNQFRFSIHVADQIDPTAIKIPPMLIQPFVENAIEHAFNGQSGENIIDISLRLDQGQLICTISDNGIGIDSYEGSRSNTKKSLATTITSERLKILSKDLKMKGEISITDRSKFNEKGTLVTLTIPYKLSQES